MELVQGSRPEVYGEITGVRNEVGGGEAGLKIRVKSGIVVDTDAIVTRREGAWTSPGRSGGAGCTQALEILKRGSEQRGLLTVIVQMHSLLGG